METTNRKSARVRVVVEIEVPARALEAIEDRIDRALDFGSIQAAVSAAAGNDRVTSVRAFCERVTETR